MPDLRIRMVERMSEVSREGWDAVANPPGDPYDPFLSWNFLDALETSGCAVEETGWGPKHLLAEREDGTLAGALPLYLKGHSQGEYVFDHAWADAFERAGGAYFPKLLTAIPFTPATGRRLLAADPEVRRALINGARHVCEQWGLSSWHILFPGEAEWEELAAAGLLQRADIQFIWTDQGYGSYEGFLRDLSSRKRKALRKERAAAQDGVVIRRLTGTDLTAAHWDVFFACYQDTGGRKWGRPYLNRDFFTLIHERMAEQVMMAVALRDGRPIATALNFIGSDTLYGRYWGCLEDQDSLHFELCYHQAIEFALERGLTRVEAGAQGHHKLARGYRPVPVYSAHHLTHEGLASAVARYLQRERPAVMAEIAAMADETPYKQS